MRASRDRAPASLRCGGRIEQLDRPDEIYERPNSRFVAEFIGESNLIEGTLEESGDAAWFIALNGMRIEVSDPRPKPEPGRSCLLLLRPEKAALGAAGADGYVVGTVAEFVYVGDFSRYRIDVHGTPLTVKVQNSRRSLSAEVGSTVGVRWDPSDACIICDPRL